MAVWLLHGPWFGEEARARNFMFPKKRLPVPPMGGGRGCDYFGHNRFFLDILYYMDINIVL